MLDYHQFISAGLDTLQSVSEENFGPTGSFGDVGPLSCAMPDACNAEILSGVFTRKAEKGNNNNNALVQHLRERVVRFQSKGWLSQHETRKFNNLLNNVPTSSNQEHALRDLERQLDMLEEKMNGGTMLNKQTRTVNLFSPASTLFTQYTPAAQSIVSDSSFGSNSITQLDNIIDPRRLSNCLSEDQIADIFVETCFFARLGFVQPPCCMQCTYRESLKEASPNERCGRFVIWRRDASKILHPDQLNENAVAIKCHAARKLQAGETVDRYSWNKAKKTLVVHPLERY
jgi:hypothetical protein